MVKLRNALMAAILATGVMGCANPPHIGDYAHWSIFHCSECDDFPMPAYGPNGSMVPGSYTGPPAQNPPSATRMMTPPSSNVPAASTEAIQAPADERPMTGTPPAPTTPGPAPDDNP